MGVQSGWVLRDGDAPREGDESVWLWVGGSRRETSVFGEVERGVGLRPF